MVGRSGKRRPRTHRCTVEGCVDLVAAVGAPLIEREDDEQVLHEVRILELAHERAGDPAIGECHSRIMAVVVHVGNIDRIVGQLTRLTVSIQLMGVHQMLRTSFGIVLNIEETDKWVVLSNRGAEVTAYEAPSRETLEVDLPGLSLGFEQVADMRDGEIDGAVGIHALSAARDEREVVALGGMGFGMNVSQERAIARDLGERRLGERGLVVGALEDHEHDPFELRHGRTRLKWKHRKSRN